MAALGGTWLAAVFGFAGLSLQSDEITINPKLPSKWRSLSFAIEWRGRRLKFRIDADHDLLQATLESGDSMTLSVNGRQHEVRCDQATVCPLSAQER
jgi:trehalose/maltose hydrolase-like predicted phosphorylase